MGFGLDARLPDSSVRQLGVGRWALGVGRWAFGGWAAGRLGGWAAGRLGGWAAERLSG